ncbi:unnamed protein product [Symbiodinium microadriaticum]|nr:unnamed protein product [Symbiodinium microadriaticum]
MDVLTARKSWLKKAPPPPTGERPLTQDMSGVKPQSLYATSCTRSDPVPDVLDIGSRYGSECPPAVAEVVGGIVEKIEKQVNAMRPQREQLRRCVEAALAASSDEFLEGCRIEVVGSTAWGGEVPQSDLDLVLVTATSAAAPPQALELLTLLRDSLEKQSEGERHWQRLELVEARKVPLLRLYDQQGLSCDVVVDQMHAIQHRKLLQEALAGRNELKTCIRLIKYWLRQRGLPIGAEGGLPSFAWAYTALQLATDLPPGTSVERLLCHFFNSLSKLSERSLAVQYRERGVNVAWKARSDPTAWSQEFIELIWVDDPTRRQQPGESEDTTVPLGLLGDYASDEEEVVDELKDKGECWFLDASSLLDDLDEAAEEAAPEAAAPTASTEELPTSGDAEVESEGLGVPEPEPAPTVVPPPAPTVVPPRVLPPLPSVSSAPPVSLEESPADLEPGCIVRAFGLQKAQALNGRKGIVRGGPTDDGRWQVEFWNDSGSAVDVNASIKRANLEFLEAAPAPEESAADFWPGCIVRAFGLQKAQALNGRMGIVRGGPTGDGRWQVEFWNDTGSAVDVNASIKRENLELLEAAPDQEEPDVMDKGDEEALAPPEDVFEGLEVGPDIPEPEPAPGKFAALDSNELQAAILQAELDGDDDTLQGLQAELALRQAKGTDGGRESVKGAQWVHESVDVPVEVVGGVIGSGGATIKAMAAESGARMCFQRDEDSQNGDAGFLSLTLSRPCLISGPAEAVAKAKELLQQTIAECGQNQGRKGKGKGKGQRKGTPANLASDLISQGAGARAGFQCGICKWYAAGFCRNRADETGACRNGLHSTEAALKAESDWIAAGPGPTTQATEAKRPILLVLDLEGGGNQDGRDGEDEIIEVPVLSMCPATGTELGRFHRFARPGFWVREAASMRQRFHVNCFNDGANSIPFPEVVEAMQQWLRDLLGLAPEEELRKESFLFVTCGNWDVKTAIPRQCNKPFPGAVDFGLQQLLFSRWTNIKEVFRDHFNLSDADAPTGMRGMLKRLRMPLAGQHHLGMDDVSNIAKILQRLIRDGCSIKATGQASLKVPGPMKGGFKGEGKGAPSNGHVAPKAAATPAGTGQVVPPRSSAPWQWGTGLVSSAPTAEAAAEDEEMEPKKELEAFLQSAPLPGETWEEEEEPAQAGEEEAPLRKPNKQLEAFLNGAAMPGSDDEDDTELFKAHEFQGEPTPTPEPFAASKPRARPGEDWLDMDEAESTRFPAPKRPAPKMEGHIGPVASLSEILGEADEAEDEGVLLEPAAKAPRIASLLASLPAPKAT